MQIIQKGSVIVLDRLESLLQKVREKIGKRFDKVTLDTKIPKDINKDKIGLAKVIFALENELTMLRELNIYELCDEVIKEERITDIDKRTYWLNLTNASNSIIINDEMKKREIFLDGLKNYYDGKNVKPFTSFYSLSLILNSLYKIGYLKSKDYLDTIMYFIKLNISLGVTTANGIERLENTHALDKNFFNYLEKNYPDHEFTAILDALLSINDSLFKEMFVKGTKDIEKIYFNKDNNYIKEDVDSLLNSLRRIHALSLPSDLFSKVLTKELMGRNKTITKMNKKAIEVLSSNKVTVNNITTLKEKEEIKPIKMRPCYTARLQKNVIDSTPIQKDIKPKKKNEIVKELSNYIDIENLTLKKEISMEDKFYILELLTDLNKDRSAINTLITNINLQISNSIGDKTLKQLRCLFANNIEKYYFYWQKKGYTDIEKYLKSLEDNFNALACESNEELEELFIDEIKNALMSLENICPATYEYEFTTLEAEKQKKKRKGGK